MKSLIFAGAGLSTLSLVMRLIENGVANNYKLLLIEKDDKQQNDRTWCYWEAGKGFFEDLVFHRWHRLDFFSQSFQSELSIDPYQYKMIRGIDLYRYCLERISRHPNIEWLRADIRSINATENDVHLELADGTIKSFDNAVGFSSISSVPETRTGDIRLLQHFKGWIIETPTPRFDADRATLMDFRVSQEQGTTFVYVLPLSTTRALVEYTLFTGQLLEPSQYEAALQDYCNTWLSLDSYDIREEEFGVIPMTNAFFPSRVNGVVQLGTAGGQTKASSGYTFQFVQKQADAIASSLKAGNYPPLTKSCPWRFRFYDHTLLHILHHRKYPGDQIFATLFQKNPASRVLRFLDNESRLLEEWKLLWSLPAWPFLKAALQKRRTY